MFENQSPVVVQTDFLGFRAGNGAGGLGDGEEVLPDLVEEVVPRIGGGTGRDAGGGIRGN